MIEDRYDEGFSEGYEVGKLDGHEEAYDEGFRDGQSELAITKLDPLRVLLALGLHTLLSVSQQLEEIATN